MTGGWQHDSPTGRCAEFFERRGPSAMLEGALALIHGAFGFMLAFANMEAPGFHKSPWQENVGGKTCAFAAVVSIALGAFHIAGLKSNAEEARQIMCLMSCLWFAMLAIAFAAAAGASTGTGVYGCLSLASGMASVLLDDMRRMASWRGSGHAA